MTETLTRTPAEPGNCIRPVLLSGHSTTVHAATGEVVRVFASADLPGGLLAMPCGNRRATQCPPCSRIYAGDAYQLISAGLHGGKDIAPAVARHPRVFATFTAPSFGPVHRGPDKRGATRPCHPRRDGSGCNRWHRAADALIGTPLDPGAYDYTGAALWNASSSALWRRFTINLRRDLARAAGLTLKDFRALASVSYAKVAEYQTRGAVHFHAVIRLDGPDGPNDPAPAWATVELLDAAIRTAATRSEVQTPDADGAPARPIDFGDQLDIRAIKTTDLASGELSDRAVSGYIAKYATKSADHTGALDTPLYCRGCSGAGHSVRLEDGAEVLSVCRRCLNTGLRRDIDDLDVTEHVRTLIQTAWNLGALPDLAPLGLRRWAHMLGFRGHFLTKGRAYSTTFAALRTARTEHARAEHRDYLIAFGLLNEHDPDPADTLVIGQWTYAGTAHLATTGGAT